MKPTEHLVGERSFKRGWWKYPGCQGPQARICNLGSLSIVLKIFSLGALTYLKQATLPEYSPELNPQQLKPTCSKGRGGFTQQPGRQAAPL